MPETIRKARSSTSAAACCITCLDIPALHSDPELAALLNVPGENAGLPALFKELDRHSREALAELSFPNVSSSLDDSRLFLISTVNGAAAADTLFRHIVLSALLTLLCNARGISISGAMELYPGTARSKQLKASTELARRKTFYPRVILGASLLQTLNELMDAADETAGDNMAEQSSHLLFTDMDGHVALDFLSEELDRWLSADDLSAARENACRHFHECFARARDQQDSLQVAKYNWLLSYCEHHGLSPD